MPYPSSEVRSIRWRLLRLGSADLPSLLLVLPRIHALRIGRSENVQRITHNNELDNSHRNDIMLRYRRWMWLHYRAVLKAHRSQHLFISAIFLGATAWPTKNKQLTAKRKVVQGENERSRRRMELRNTTWKTQPFWTHDQGTSAHKKQQTNHGRGPHNKHKRNRLEVRCCMCWCVKKKPTITRQYKLELNKLGNTSRTQSNRTEDNKLRFVAEWHEMNKGMYSYEQFWTSNIKIR